MSAEKRGAVTGEPLLKTIKAVQSGVSRLYDELRQVKERLGSLEMQYASLSNRIDRIDRRLERVERRLELVAV
jgi:predicted  nucleic acid-binding Zn-ribbon protein